jgi:hypothetical protein
MTGGLDQLIQPLVPGDLSAGEIEEFSTRDRAIALKHRVVLYDHLDALVCQFCALLIRDSRV